MFSVGEALCFIFGGEVALQMCNTTRRCLFMWHAVYKYPGTSFKSHVALQPASWPSLAFDVQFLESQSLITLKPGQLKDIYRPGIC